VNISNWWLSVGDGTDIQRMVAVQQLLHGLTGGEATALQDVAEKTVKRLAKPIVDRGGRTPTSDELCALGFAYHLLGDSFAHQTIDKPKTGEWRMYETGYGHLRDFHNPDYPLYDLTGVHTRWDAWSKYTTNGGLYAGTFDGHLVEQLAQGIAEGARKGSCWFGLRSGPQCLDNYGDDLIEERIGDALKELKPLQCLAPMIEKHTYSPCDQYMDASLVKETTCHPSCRGAWDLYKRVAAEELTANERARAATYQSLEAGDYADPDLSPSDRGAAACPGESVPVSDHQKCPYPNATPSR
jgi:hypothetical protein